MNQPPDFNGLARVYRWLEYFSFGPWLALTRRTFLPDLAHAHRALVLGDGDGRFTARLLEENQSVQIDAVDASAAMLHALRRRARPHAARVHVHLADARNWQLPVPITAPPYDLIATHFFLDCLTTREIRLLAARLHAATASSAVWVVSEFAHPPGWPGRWIARPLVSVLYFSFGLLTGLAVRSLPDHAGALRHAGFTLIKRHSRLGGLLIGELWSAGAHDSTLTPGRPSR